MKDQSVFPASDSAHTRIARAAELQTKTIELSSNENLEHKLIVKGEFTNDQGSRSIHFTEIIGNSIRWNISKRHDGIRSESMIANDGSISFNGMAVMTISSRMEINVARHQRIGMILSALTLSLLFAWSFSSQLATAQSGKSKSKKPLSASEIRQIDVRLEKLQETFESESNAIIDGFERSGQYERAKNLLEVILKLDPKNESVIKRITELDDRVLERTESERRFEVTGEWTLVGNVTKDQPARVEASGDYKLNLPTANLGPAGFPSADLEHDLQPQIPTGALMGMVVTEANLREKKPPPPFAIKTKFDFTPSQNGGLYLRINLPPGSKSTGELKLKLFGIARTT